jgi:hypothetical protein
LELAVADLLGHIDWNDLPSNDATYLSGAAAKFYDGNGYVNYYPAASRMSSYQNLVQSLNPKLWLAANYPLGMIRLQAGTSFTQGNWFPQLGVGYQFNPRWQLKADFDVRFRTLSVSLEHPWFCLSLRTDSGNADTSKAYGLSGTISIPFDGR